MGRRRARFPHRQRALSRRRGAAGDSRSADRIFQGVGRYCSRTSFKRSRLPTVGIASVYRVMPIDRQATFSGTKDVAGALAIDAARLETLLASRLPDFKGPLRVRQFKGGQSNPTYLLETPARRFVLRRKPPGKLLPSAHAVDREFRVISALHAQSFPVAAPLLYCDDAG